MWGVAFLFGWEKSESLGFSRNGVTVLNTWQKVVLKEDFVLEKSFFKCMRVNLNSQSRRQDPERVCMLILSQW